MRLPVDAERLLLVRKMCKISLGLQLTNGGSLRSDRPSTSLLISMRMSRRAGLFTSTSVWVCWPLWLMIRRSTRTGFFLSSFLSGFPDLTSFVVYVRLACSALESGFYEKPRAHRSNLSRYYQWYSKCAWLVLRASQTHTSAYRRIRLGGVFPETAFSFSPSLTVVTATCTSFFTSCLPLSSAISPMASI